MNLSPVEKIKLLRIRLKISQTELGEMLDLSQMQISRLERGKLNVDEKEKKRIEHILRENIWKGDNGHDY